MKFFDDDVDDTQTRPTAEELAAIVAAEIAKREALQREASQQVASQREASWREANRRILARIPADTIEGLTRIIADADKPVRFAILPFLEPKFYVDKLSDEGMIHVHVILLALQYTNADPKTGSYKKDDLIEWGIRFVALDYVDWRKVLLLAPEDRSIYDIDMVLTKGDYVGYYDDDDYVEIMTGYEFFLRSTKAKWKQNPEVDAAVESAVRALLGC